MGWVFVILGGVLNFSGNAELITLNQFTLESIGGYLANTDLSAEDNGIGYYNKFQEIEIPEVSIASEEYREGGSLFPKVVSSGLPEFGTISLRKGSCTLNYNNPLYKLYHSTLYGLAYRTSFLIKVYDLKSVPKSSGILKANTILYVIIKDAVIESFTPILGLSSDSGEINVAEIQLKPSFVHWGTYRIKESD